MVQEEVEMTFRSQINDAFMLKARIAAAEITDAA